VSFDSLPALKKKRPRRQALPRAAAPAAGERPAAEAGATVLAGAKTPEAPVAPDPNRSELDNALAQIVGDDAEEVVLEEEVPESEVRRNAGPLNRGAALAVLGSAAMEAATCRFEGDPTGTGRVRVTFDTDGLVSAVRVPAPFRGTRAGDCIDDAFSGARIPEFRGAPVTLKRKFRIPE